MEATSSNQAKAGNNAVPTFEEFKAKFRFDIHKPGTAQIRRQRILMDGPRPAERGDELVKHLSDGFLHEWGWKTGLALWQLNHDTAFHNPENQRAFFDEMRLADQMAEKAVEHMGLSLRLEEIPQSLVPQMMRPTPKYEELCKRHSYEALLPSLCTCTVRIKIAVRDLKMIRECSNLLRSHIEKLAIQTKSQKQKSWQKNILLTLQSPIPPIFNTDYEMYEDALKNGYAANPRAAPYVTWGDQDGSFVAGLYGNSDNLMHICKWQQTTFQILAPALR